MPNRDYTPEEKKLVRRLLLLHSGNTMLVHQLTGFPRRTIQHWRQQWDDDYELYSDALARNLLAHANAIAAVQSPPIPDQHSDSSIAPAQDAFAQYAQIRDQLMNHAITLSNNLLLGDDFLNQRVHALTRLIDRILILDNLLPDQQPEDETVIRHEFYYDGAVQASPPWEGVNTYEGAKRYNENYLKGMKQSMDEKLARDFPAEAETPWTEAP